MSHRNTMIRSLHDVGLAAWFGGSLMGAVGLNAAAAAASAPQERTTLSSIGWARWTPVNAAAIAAHLVGGAGLIVTNKARVSAQPGARANTAAKAGLTVAAAALTAYSRALGKKVEAHADEGAVGTTEPAPAASGELQSAQRQLKLAQWALPALTGALLVLGADQGEQQRPKSLLRSQLARVTG
jgi:hypothetical protein